MATLLIPLRFRWWQFYYRFHVWNVGCTDSSWSFDWNLRSSRWYWRHWCRIELEAGVAISLTKLQLCRIVKLHGLNGVRSSNNHHRLIMLGKEPFMMAGWMVSDGYIYTYIHMYIYIPCTYKLHKPMVWKLNGTLCHVNAHR